MTADASLAYGSLYAAAVLEGELAFVTACVAVAAGHLAPLPVMIVGALGAATGDQFYFYLLRGRLSRWLESFRPLAMRRSAIVHRVRRHEVPMILVLRFVPGLRIALAAACAYANVSPLRFTMWNTLAAFIWAAILLEAVTRLGPATLQRFGLHGASAAVVAAVALLLVAVAIGIVVRRKTASADPSQAS